MKVGDIVRQNGKLVNLKGPLIQRGPRDSLGIIVKIRDDQYPLDWEMTESRKSWLKTIGRRVTVLWQSGKVSKGFAENGLTVICKGVDYAGR